MDKAFKISALANKNNHSYAGYSIEIPKGTFPEVEELVFDVPVYNFIAKNYQFPNLQRVTDTSGGNGFFFLRDGCLYETQEDWKHRNRTYLYNVFSNEDETLRIVPECERAAGEGDALRNVKATEIEWKSLDPDDASMELLRGSGWEERHKNDGAIIFNRIMIGISGENPDEISVSGDNADSISIECIKRDTKIGTLVLEHTARLSRDSMFENLIVHSGKVVLKNADREDIKAFIKTALGFSASAICETTFSELELSGDCDPAYRIIGGALYKDEGRTLLFMPPACPADPVFPENLERIAGGSIRSNTIRELRVPDSVKVIEKNGIELQSEGGQRVQFGKGVAFLMEDTARLHTARLVIPGNAHVVMHNAFRQVRTDEAVFENGVNIIERRALSMYGGTVRVPETVVYVESGAFGCPGRVVFRKPIHGMARSITGPNDIVSEICVESTGKTYHIPKGASLENIDMDIEDGKADERKWFYDALARMGREKSASAFDVAMEIIERWPDEKEKERGESLAVQTVKAWIYRRAKEAMKQGKEDSVIRLLKSGMMSAQGVQKILLAAQDAKLVQVCAYAAEAKKEQKTKEAKRNVFAL